MASGSQNNTTYQAQKWTNLRAFTIGNTAKNVDGTAAVSWSKDEILGASTNAYFLRGDKAWSNTLNGIFTANGTITANGGYLISTANGNTVTIGSQNTGFCHITSSANVPFWFNKEIQVDGNIMPYTSTTRLLGDASHEWSSIDTRQLYVRHVDSSRNFTDDLNIYYGYQRGLHHLFYSCNNGASRVHCTTIDVDGIWCKSGWFRSYGNTGWYNETYGGGWYMVDSTYIRNFGSKQVYLNAQLGVDATLRLWNNTRQITRASRSVDWISGRDSALMREDDASGYHGVVMTKTVNGAWTIGNYNYSGWYNYLLFSYTSDSNYNAGTNTATTIRMRDSGVVESAMWNDYAEYRKANTIEPGRVVVETGNDDLQLCNQRLVAGGRVISDTYGFAIGQTKDCQTPIAVSGRVLVYPYKNRNKFRPGDAVCTAPNGTVDVMTRKEIILYPERIIGTVSAVPTYETWYGGGNYDEDGDLIPIPVNGRIWIYVR